MAKVSTSTHRVVRRGRTKKPVAVILKNVPPGYDWGSYSREDPRMHLQTVDDKHKRLYKVWLERNGKRAFEPAISKADGQIDAIPKKILDRLEKAVAAKRSHVEARWVSLMIAQQWIRLNVSGSLITLTVYANYPTRFTRTVDLAQVFPGLYDPSYPTSPKKPIRPEEVILSRDLAAIEIWPQKDIADRHHIFLPPILWRD